MGHTIPQQSFRCLSCPSAILVVLLHIQDIVYPALCSLRNLVSPRHTSVQLGLRVEFGVMTNLLPYTAAVTS
jgi:hypothetical protein